LRRPESRWSEDARVLFEPARVFGDAAHRAARPGAWWRRPAGLLFAFGCFVSILASGRLSARLILDGALSFGFVVLIEIAALAVVARIGRGARARGPAASFARDLDTFFIGNAPWLAWLTVVGAVFAVVPPRAMMAWFGLAILSALMPAVWSVWVDFHFFREVLGRSPRGACVAILLNRAIGWTAAIGIFLGIAIWSQYSPLLASWVGR